jgi:hypothetical protein
MYYFLRGRHKNEELTCQNLKSRTSNCTLESYKAQHSLLHKLDIDNSLKSLVKEAKLSCPEKSYKWYPKRFLNGICNRRFSTFLLINIRGQAQTDATEQIDIKTADHKSILTAKCPVEPQSKLCVASNLKAQPHSKRFVSFLVSYPKARAHRPRRKYKRESMHELIALPYRHKHTKQEGLP